MTLGVFTLHQTDLVSGKVVGVIWCEYTFILDPRYDLVNGRRKNVPGGVRPLHTQVASVERDELCLLLAQLL